MGECSNWVEQQKHEIDGKIVDAKRAKSRNMPDYGPICKVIVNFLLRCVIQCFV